MYFVNSIEWPHLLIESHWIVAIDLSPLNYKHWTVAYEFLPLNRHHGTVAIEPLPLNYCTHLTNYRPGNWSCDLVLPMRGLKKNCNERGKTERHTHRQRRYGLIEQIGLWADLFQIKFVSSFQKVFYPYSTLKHLIGSEQDEQSDILCFNLLNSLNIFFVFLLIIPFSLSWNTLKAVFWDTFEPFSGVSIVWGFGQWTSPDCLAHGENEDDLSWSWSDRWPLACQLHPIGSSLARLQS